MRRNLADQRDVFFFYLAVTSYANSTCKVKKGEDVDDSCPKNFFHSVSLAMSGSVIKTFADERLLAIIIATSVFHFPLPIASG